MKPNDIGRVIVQELDYPKYMDKKYLEFLLDTLPEIKPDDPENPEWPATPLIEAVLKRNNQEFVYCIKNESKNRNGGTLKSRKALELGPVFYRVFGDNLYRQELNGTLSRVRIPRFTEITAGNNGLAQILTNEEFNLPPPNLILDINTPRETLDALIGKRANIYLVPLNYNIFTEKSEHYTAKQLNMIANNTNGHDIDSSRIVNPQKDFYDWHWVAEIFNLNPDRVYGPYGSGEWFANGITWQRETAYNGERKKDARLKTSPENVTRISIIAVEPERVMDSKANKLTGMKPFVYYSDNDIRGMKLARFTGQDTKILRVSEDYIDEGYKEMSKHSNTSYSGSAGMAGFLKDIDDEKISSRGKYIIVNSGSGI